MRRTYLLSIVLALLSVAQLYADPGPDAVRDLTSQILCTCGCSNMLVSSCECSKAAEMKKEAAALFDSGESEQEVLAAFEKEYGAVVLAAPEAQGFNLVGWIMPFVALAMGSLIVAVVFRRLRTPSAPVEDGDSESTAPGQPEMADRFRQQLDEELRR